jgi:hypothetical protein
LQPKFHDAIEFMNARRFAARFSVIILVFAGAFPSLSSAQQRAETADDSMSFASAFLHLFYPELTGKKYAITFETARSYDKPAEDADRIFLVDIGDGAKSNVVMCCFGGSMGEIFRPQLPDDKDLGPHAPLPAPPAPPKVRPEKPMNIDSKGAVHPYQYRSTVFIFDPRGRLKRFVWNRSPTAAEFRLSDKLALHPEMSDEELIAAYKESGAKYALGDREAFERDLPIGKLEQFLGKLKILRKEFSGTTDDRWARLGYFVMCTVLLQTDDVAGEHLKYESDFEPRGELVDLRTVTDNKEP